MVAFRLLCNLIATAKSLSLIPKMLFIITWQDCEVSLNRLLLRRLSYLMKEFWSMAPLFRIVLLVAISPEEQWHFPVEMRLATIILCLPVAHLFHFQVSSWVYNIFALIDAGIFYHAFGDFCWGSCVSQVLWKNILASITPILLGCWWDFELPGTVK